MNQAPTAQSSTVTLQEGYLLDFVSGAQQLRDSPKEQVRQRLARALSEEYGIPPDCMALDYPLHLAGRSIKVDLVVFSAGPHLETRSVERVAICRAEPPSTRGRAAIRDHEQAHADLERVEATMRALPDCRYGMWTNGLEVFYLERRDDNSIRPAADWPLRNVDPKNASKQVLQARAADPEMLLLAFRRCHSFVHGNEGMPKDAAFWQFLYLIFAKLYDEQFPRNDRRFWAGVYEPFTDAGREAISERVLLLFEEAKRAYRGIFRGNEELTLSNRALAFMVSELARYEFSSTSLDAKGAAYQEIVGANLRGDRGQYFTPRNVINLAVEMINPRADERLLDPACGTGGFLVSALAHRHRELIQDTSRDTVATSLRNYASRYVFGADFDPFLIRATQMNMVMSGDGSTHLYHMNSLEFPHGKLQDVVRGRVDIPFGSIDVLLTNPPFGSDIPINDPEILRNFELAHRWDRSEDGFFARRAELQKSVAPEVLFIERSVQWLRPEGRMAIVVPNGILGNPAAEYIRRWLLSHCWLLASVEFPVEAFLVEAGVNILTSLLVLRKRTSPTVSSQEPYPVFMAMADRVGYDRRGNRLYRRAASGEELVTISTNSESFVIAGETVERQVRRVERLVDDDLPAIAKEYRTFVAENQQYPHLRDV